MPFLSRKPAGHELAATAAAGRELVALGSRSRNSEQSRQADVPARLHAGLLETCANPACSTSWLHLWRSRTAPIFEGGWNCSAACTRTRIEAALSREMNGRGAVVENHRHRIPLGLVMLEQGWINTGQLRQALDAQKTAGTGRLGDWLMRQQGVGESLITRALSLQWSCPVLPVESHDPEALTVVMPRLFVDAFAALPLRIAAGRILYLGFEDRLDPVLALAMERMTGLRVESGLVQGSRFRAAQVRMLEAAFPPVRLIEAASEPALAHVLTQAIERARPLEARLVRVHDCLWLRLWRRPQTGQLPERDAVEDILCSIGAH